MNNHLDLYFCVKQMFIEISLKELQRSPALPQESHLQNLVGRTDLLVSL